ncbi:MAG TPA: AI-2E family transporter [Casimicrobiaceae bacterium]|nr:AI-2E family transporter [Casimicrobiaceae bacterium]
MTSPADDDASSRYVSTGPLVWVATLAITTLLLLALKQALWLVVPFLVAVVVYYALFPPVHRLMLAGVHRSAAATIVAGAFVVAAILALVPAVMWSAAHAVSGQEAFYRYLDAGRVLIGKTLAMLEARFGFLERMHFHDQVERRMAEFGESNLQQQIASALLGAAAWLPSLLLAPFFAYFFLRDGQRFFKFVGAAVPNAYFERTLYMLERFDTTARAYFQGLLGLAAIDTVCMGLGLWVIGIPNALMLGAVTAVLSWVPVIGPFIGAILVVLVTATDFPNQPELVYAAIALLVSMRLLDDFVFMPLTVGRSLRMHPLPTVLLIFIGGAVAGVPGLILALPLAGLVMVIVGTIGGILDDPRLRARHAFAKRLRAQRITADLGSND